MRERVSQRARRHIAFGRSLCEYHRPNSNVQHRQPAQHHPHPGDAKHAVFQPFAACQQGHGGQRDRDLQRGGGLGPAVVQVHLVVRLLVPVGGVGLQLLGGGLDVGLFLSCNGPLPVRIPAAIPAAVA